MIKKEKSAFISEFGDDFAKMKSCFFADFRGLSVKKFTEFRRKLHDEKVQIRVVKNKLVSKAVNKVGNGNFADFLKGPTCVIFSLNDEVKPAKIVSDFVKKEEKFKLKGGYLPGKVLNIAEVAALSLLPSRDVLLTKMLFCLKSPISGFVNVLNGNITGLLYALRAIEKQKKDAEERVVAG